MATIDPLLTITAVSRDSNFMVRDRRCRVETSSEADQQAMSFLNHPRALANRECVSNSCADERYSTSSVQLLQRASANLDPGLIEATFDLCSTVARCSTYHRPARVLIHHSGRCLLLSARMARPA